MIALCILGYIVTGVLVLWAVDRMHKHISPDTYEPPEEAGMTAFVFLVFLVVWPISGLVETILVLNETEEGNIVTVIFGILDSMFQSVKNLLT